MFDLSTEIQIFTLNVCERQLTISRKDNFKLQCQKPRLTFICFNRLRNKRILDAHVNFVITLLATAEQQNHRKNIQILFLPADVMRNMRKNHTEKELLPGFPGQGAKHWIPVRLPGNKTRSFEIRINPLLARKLHLNLQHFSIGHGYGLLLELKNVSLSSKGQTVLDRLVEFYKNCGTEEKFPRLNMTQRIRRPHPSLMLSGNIALMKRIQNALKHFSPKRLEGLKDVLKHKNSSGVVLHLVPLADMGQKVNKLIKRTMATRGCVKIKTNALTHALEVFRRQLGSDRNRTRVNKNESTNLSHGDDTRKTDVHENNNNKTNNNSNNNHNSNNNTNSINNHSNNNNRNNRNNTNQKSNEELKERKELSFPRDLKSSSIHPESKMNFESSSAINVPGSTAVTKIVPALTSLRKMITHVPLSGANKKASQSLVKKKDEGTSLASNEDENRAHVNTFTNDISSVNGKMNNEMGFELSEVKNVPNKMVIDTEFDDKRRKNNAGDGYNEGNVSETGSWNGQENNGAMASKMKTSQQDLFTSKAKKENDSIEDQRNGSKILAEFGGNDHNSRPVNQTVNPFQTVKGPKGIKDSKNVLALSGPPEQTTTTNNKQGRKGPSVTFYYKPTRLKLHIKGRGYVKEDHSEEDDLDSESYEGEGRFLKLVHMRRRKPRVKGMKPQDELNEQGEIAKQDKLEKQDNNQHRKFGDSPIDASYDGNVDNTKLRLEGEFRRLGAHGPEPHKPKLKRLKLHFKGRKYAKVKEGNDEDDLHSESYEGEGRFVKLIHMRRRKPHVKGMKLQDNLDEQDKPENQNNNQHRKFHDSPVDASYDGNEDNMKVRLGGNVLKLRGHSHASFIHRHKRPKIRVVLYDNNEEEKKERHNHSWRNGKTEKINEDDYEAESEPMDSENLGTYEQDNSESDVSDSIGNDDNSHLGRSKSAGEVPDLGPYLRKHFG